MSLPMRGEWIEISNSVSQIPLKMRLSPCGESGLKWHSMATAAAETGVSPHAGRVD